MKVMLIVMGMLLAKPFCIKVAAQQYEIEVLLLNFEKLMQFRQILEDMKKGYEIISLGYGTIKNIAEGNFSLHDLFLDKLMEASPTVQNYYKVAEIIKMQTALMKEYKEGLNVIRSSRWLLASESTYIERMYNKLFKSSLQSLDELFSVITARQYRMTDDERLARIDRIHQRVQMQVIDMRKINALSGDIIYERSSEAMQIDVMRSIQGIQKD